MPQLPALLSSQVPGVHVAQTGPAWTVGTTATVQASYTRPNDANAYAAGDVVSNSTTTAQSLPLIFQNIARFPGGGGIMLSAVMIDSVAAATKPDLQLYVFDTPPIMQGDNAAWAPTDAEVLLNTGYINFPVGSFQTAGANGMTTATGLGMAFNCAANSTSMYGILVVRNAYTPTALEQFLIRLQVLQD